MAKLFCVFIIYFSSIKVSESNFRIKINFKHSKIKFFTPEFILPFVIFALLENQTKQLISQTNYDYVIILTMWFKIVHMCRQKYVSIQKGNCMINRWLNQSKLWRRSRWRGFIGLIKHSSGSFGSIRSIDNWSRSLIKHEFLFY